MSKTCLVLTGSIVFEMGRQTHSNKIKANKKGGGVKIRGWMLSSSPITSISQFIFFIFYFKSSHGLIKGGGQPLLIHFLRVHLIEKSLLRQKSGKVGG